MKNKITITALFGVVLIISAGIYFIQKINNITTFKEDDVASFDRACQYDKKEQELFCDANKLNKILELRANTPNFKLYTDSKIMISFEYPSSISEVTSTTTNQGVRIIRIDPIIPGNIATTFWGGTSIFVKDCGDICPQDLKLYLTKEYPTIAIQDSGIETLEISSTTISFAQHFWTEAEIYYVMGNSYKSYSIVNKNRIIEIITDVDFEKMTPNIVKAFNKILDSIKF
ncbi:MAG: hypothetical protein WC827_00650 [Candidatus Paceibacterota bacterium]